MAEDGSVRRELCVTLPNGVSAEQLLVKRAGNCKWLGKAESKISPGRKDDFGFRNTKVGRVGVCAQGHRRWILRFLSLMGTASAMTLLLIRGSGCGGCR